MFSFVFSLGAIDGANTTYGILALIGYVYCIPASIYKGALARHDGFALEAWFKIYAVVTAAVLIWFLTQLGNVFS